MSDFDELRAKVEQTTGRLTAAQADRQRRTDELLTMLARLEQRFNAQEDELAFYRDRVVPLEQSNRELSMLMQSLIDTVNAEVIGADDDPLHRATEMAERLLSEDMGGVVPPANAEPDAEDSDVRFEDVTPEQLAAEEEAETATTESPLPPEAIDAEAEALAFAIGSGGAENRFEDGESDSWSLDGDDGSMDGDGGALDGAAEPMSPAVADTIAAQTEAPSIGTPDADSDLEIQFAADEPFVAEFGDTFPEPGTDDDEPITAELDIPEPEAVIAGNPANRKPDIRELLRRVEEAALRAHALTEAHAHDETDDAATETEAPSADKDSAAA